MLIKAIRIITVLILSFLYQKTNAQLGNVDLKSYYNILIYYNNKLNFENDLYVKKVKKHMIDNKQTNNSIILSKTFFLVNEEYQKLISKIDSLEWYYASELANQSIIEKKYNEIINFYSLIDKSSFFGVQKSILDYTTFEEFENRYFNSRDPMYVLMNIQLIKGEVSIKMNEVCKSMAEEYGIILFEK